MIDDPHDPLNGYRPDMGQRPEDDKGDHWDRWPPGWWMYPVKYDNFPNGWWVLPAIILGAFIWVALALYLLSWVLV